MKRLLTKRKTILAGLVLLQLLGGGLSQAATITLDWVDSGWWDSDGNHSSTNENYIAGESNGTTKRNFFVFDLSGVTDPVVSATLKLFNPGHVFNGFVFNGFASSNPTETYTLFDVTTPIPDLTAGFFAQNHIYADLGSGTQFGSQSVSAADNGAIVSISLNGDALTAIDGASGLFALGGAVTTLVPPLDWEYIFGYTGNHSYVRQLVLETQDAPAPVPEPSTMLLLGSGLVGLIGYRMKKARA